MCSRFTPLHHTFKKPARKLLTRPVPPLKVSYFIFQYAKIIVNVIFIKYVNSSTRSLNPGIWAKNFRSGIILVVCRYLTFFFINQKEITDFCWPEKKICHECWYLSRLRLFFPHQKDMPLMLVFFFAPQKLIAGMFCFWSW